jgi:biopolymer transport protein ExbD
MQTTSDNSDGEPMMDMNVTPLIDVMLVLLIMFIITIPIQTHAVKLDLPVNQQNQPPPPIDPVKTSCRSMRTVLWNGSPVSMTARSYWTDAADEPGPGTSLQPTRPRAMVSTRCRVTNGRTSRRWASSATNII